MWPPGAVYFAGFVHRDELASYYALAECLVLPTHTDPWGLVVNEAMACGLPIICTDIAGCAADLVKDNGRLVAAREVQGLAEAMQQIARNSQLREHMSRESRNLIRSYSPEACAAGIAQAVSAEPRIVRNEDAISRGPSSESINITPAGALDQL